MQLTPKETSLLKDMQDQEQLCIDKYTKHAGCAKDPQLKDLFTQIASSEQQHYDALEQMKSGTVAAPFSAGSSQPSFTARYNMTDNPDKQNDCYLCTDLLSGEKHASQLYDTCIFEFKDENARTLLNSIQKAEQGHGKALYDYMSVNSMYN